MIKIKIQVRFKSYQEAALNQISDSEGDPEGGQGSLEGSLKGQRLALKEWAVAVKALAQGETILLLRKGGICEQGFTLPDQQPRFWLYPTYEHQQPHLLKPVYASQVTPVVSGWHPQTVAIQAWATVTAWFELTSVPELEALMPCHIWNEAFVSERLKWKPSLPLTALLLRVYVLPQPQLLPYQQAYGGCKSWIKLSEADFNLSANPSTNPSAATPALPDALYQQQAQAILSLRPTCPESPNI